MSQIVQLNSVSQYTKNHNNEVFHPLVSIIDFTKAPAPKERFKVQIGFYCVFLKDISGCEIRYGRSSYDYQQDTLVFFAPQQIIEVIPNENSSPINAKGLIFHPDLLHGTSLAKTISSYRFFDYQTNEALHLSEREKQLVINCFEEIQNELQQNIDKHSKKLIASNIELLLNYCERFYDRQFITRQQMNQGILERFEKILNDYFSEDSNLKSGIPSVAYCAEKLHLSTNYFGDLIKKKMGKSAKEYIHIKTIEFAKTLVLNPQKNVSEIAYELGFEYPQNFTRLFKKVVGISPNEFRKGK